MRRVKAKERKRAGSIYCDHCKPEKVDAVWRKVGFADHNGDFACEEHKKLIRVSNDNGYVSEGESQAMGLFGL